MVFDWRWLRDGEVLLISYTWYLAICFPDRRSSTLYQRGNGTCEATSNEDDEADSRTYLPEAFSRRRYLMGPDCQPWSPTGSRGGRLSGTSTFEVHHQASTALTNLLLARPYQNFEIPA